MRPSWLTRLLGINRNSGVAESHHLAAGRVLSRDEFVGLAPEAHGLPATGGALWYDYRTDEGDRLTLAFGLAAARFGAVLANYADAIEPIRDGSRVAGMKVRDAVSGEHHRGARAGHGERGGRGRRAADGGIRGPAGVSPAQGDEHRDHAAGERAGAGPADS